jgi:UDP-GlcNAc:undecaprenyl-phosphate GlcNAc-1-phosphate transferase
MARIGFSQRRTVSYLYAWTMLLAGLAVALRLLPYHRNGHYSALWIAVLSLLGLLALAASVYLIYVLEIFKFKGIRAAELRDVDPQTSEHEIEEQVSRDIETGDFERVR